MVLNKTKNSERLAGSTPTWQVTLVAIATREGQRRLIQVYQRLLNQQEVPAELKLTAKVAETARISKEVSN